MIAIIIALWIAVFGTSNGCAMPSPDDRAPEIQVELTGSLVVNAEKHVLKIANDTIIDLELPEKTDAKEYIGKSVVIKGMLTINKDGAEGKQQKMHCRVSQIRLIDVAQGAKKEAEGKRGQLTQPELIAALQKNGEMIVLYERGQGESVVELCKSLGLEVKEHYGTGNYLVCKWKKNADLQKVIRELRSSSKVRSIEPNRRIEIDPPK